MVTLRNCGALAVGAGRGSETTVAVALVAEPLMPPSMGTKSTPPATLLATVALVSSVVPL